MLKVFMNIIRITLLFLLFGSTLLSQNIKELTNSPRKTMETHLKYLQKDNYNPEISAKTLNISKAGNEKSIELAIKLKKY